MRIKKFLVAGITLIWCALSVHYALIIHQWASTPLWNTPEYFTVESWGLGCLAVATWGINKLLEE